MITEDYVSFETAKLLKEKGFEGDTSCYYVPDSSICWHYQHYQDFDKKDRIECPTLQMAMKWLREVYKCLIVVGNKNGNYLYLIKDLKANTDLGISNDEYIHYDEACEAAIKYCLENLI